MTDDSMKFPVFASHELARCSSMDLERWLSLDARASRAAAISRIRSERSPEFWMVMVAPLEMIYSQGDYAC
jgi:hypothetical protein